MAPVSGNSMSTRAALYLRLSRDDAGAGESVSIGGQRAMLRAFATDHGWTVVGEHQVFFAGRDETLTLTHAATSRKVFATGAICAALFLCEQRPGLYSMADPLAGTNQERM